MRRYSESELNDIVQSCKNSLTVLCSVFGALDDGKKIRVVLHLSEYITAKYAKDNLESDVNGRVYLDNSDVIMSYPMDLRDNVRKLLYARDTFIKFPDSVSQVSAWGALWNSGSLRELLEREDFM